VKKNFKMEKMDLSCLSIKLQATHGKEGRGSTIPTKETKTQQHEKIRSIAMQKEQHFNGPVCT
jgi:hypothetical protein